MPTISKKTRFVNTNYKYHEIVKVKTAAKFNKKYGAMEVNLKKPTTERDGTFPAIV